MLSHATARDWLIPYADGMLASDEQRRVDGHLVRCGSCSAELRQVRELNLLLVSLPPAPPAAFAPFWLKLQAVLPQRRSLRAPKPTRYRRLGLALAIAALAALGITGSALAAPDAMPDSVLYPVKQFEEGVQLATAPAADQLAVEVQQANERLHEAAVMSANHKPLLAANSLRAFQVTLNDATSALKKADPRIARQDQDRMAAGLRTVEDINAAKNDDDADVRQLVAASLTDLDRVEQAESDASTLIVIDGPTPEPTPAATHTPTRTPRPTIRPTPRPEPTDWDRHR